MLFSQNVPTIKDHCGKPSHLQQFRPNKEKRKLYSKFTAHNNRVDPLTVLVPDEPRLTGCPGEMIHILPRHASMYVVSLFVLGPAEDLMIYKISRSKTCQ
jgi:hypothetical protein